MAGECKVAGLFWQALKKMIEDHRSHSFTCKNETRVQSKPNTNHHQQNEEKLEKSDGMKFVGNTEALE